jgi:hypothetical protein
MTATEILAASRVNLIESAANFWADAELLTHLNRGVSDLWRAISNVHQDYFFTTSIAASMAANTATLTAVPTDVSIILGIEPVTPASYPSLNFFPRRYTHPDMVAARAQDAEDPGSAGPIYYAPTGAGGPVGAPVIYVAPKITAAVPLRLTYVPTIPTLVGATANPIPGQSDQALIAWVTAHALGKQASQVPDAGWMAVYKVEKDNILLFVAPRQDDEPDVAEAIFEGY